MLCQFVRLRLPNVERKDHVNRTTKAATPLAFTTAGTLFALAPTAAHAAGPNTGHMLKWPSFEFPTTHCSTAF